MTDIAGFSKRMTIRAEQFENGVENMMREVGLAVDQAVVFGTPVDTGRAKSNWIAEIGSEPGDVISAYAPGKAGSTERENEQAAISQAEAVISGYTLGQAIFISNGLPYIGELNQGTSAQAAAGFVETATIQASEAVAAARIFKD